MGHKYLKGIKSFPVRCCIINCFDLKWTILSKIKGFLCLAAILLIYNYGIVVTVIIQIKFIEMFYD